jgi:hypothetical protein
MVGSKMREQLQQTGVLQRVAAIMEVLAADLRSEAAAIAALSRDELASCLDRFAAISSGSGSNLAGLVCLHMLHCRQFQWCASDAGLNQPDDVKCCVWLSGPSASASGHAEAVMQLCTAALQHISSVLE